MQDFADAVHAGGDEADHVCEAAAKGKFTRTAAPVAHVALTPLVRHLYECIIHRGWESGCRRRRSAAQALRHAGGAA